MKTLVTCVCIIFFTAISTPTWANDLANLYPEKLEQAKNLYPLAAKFFKGPGSLAPGEALTPEMIKSPDRQQAYYKLRRLLGLAIDAGYDLSDLSEFGLVKEKQGYIINFAQYPQWAPIKSLFIQLREPKDLRVASYYLRKKGLSNQDIEKLSLFLSSRNPKIEAMQAAQKTVQQKQSEFSKTLKVSAKMPTSEIVSLHEKVKKSKHDSWHTWASNLLDMYPVYKQRIIIDYLQENLGYVAIGKAPINSDYLQRYAMNVASGDEYKDLNETITDLKKQTK